jgi:hypothetical protein
MRNVCPECGVGLELHKDFRYSIWAAVFLLATVSLLFLFASLAFYISDNYPSFVQGKIFKVGYPFVCGVFVFILYLGPDKYFSSKWGRFRAKAT